MPSDIKIYEALGCVADKRITADGNNAMVSSSSGNKSYNVIYDPEKNAITTNDNGSYWQGYLGYPAIAFLLVQNIISYDPSCAEALRRIPWKDINVRNKNDFVKTQRDIIARAVLQGYDATHLESEVGKIREQIHVLGLNKLGKTAKPPAGY